MLAAVFLPPPCHLSNSSDTLVLTDGSTSLQIRQIKTITMQKGIACCWFKDVIDPSGCLVRQIQYQGKLDYFDPKTVGVHTNSPPVAV